MGILIGIGIGIMAQLVVVGLDLGTIRNRLTEIRDLLKKTNE